MPAESTTGAPSRRAPSRLARAAAWSGVAAWLVALSAGVVWSFRWDSQPGTRATPPVNWPASAPVGLDRQRSTLVLFAHPHCVCTRATLTELDRLLARSEGRLSAWVMFYSDPALGAEWVRSASWERASAIPGVRVAADPEGVTAHRFGAVTSGTVVVYSPDGQLRFHGGITAGRGHEGDCAGSAAILALAAGEPSVVSTTEVFGCSLVAEGASR